MWFALAVLSAFFNSLSNVARRTHGSLAEPAELAWWTMVLSLPLGLGLLLTDRHPIHLSWALVLPAVLSSGIGVYAGIQQFKAYKYGDASAVSPISNLLPIAMMVSSLLVLGTVPSPLGFAGIVLAVGGVYYSSVSGKHSLFAPLRQLISQKGSRAMLRWVIGAAIATTFMQMALKHGSPALVMFLTTLTQVVVLSVYLLLRPIPKRIKRGEKVLRRWGWHMAAIAVFGTISVFFQLQAMSFVDASYVLSVKRLDVLITVVLAGLFLKEKHIMKRFQGSAIAVLGVILIYIAT
jgi:drug/metabolite transporter (DMT)-like permease